MGEIDLILDCCKTSSPISKVEKYTLQISLDIPNVGNLLNSNWGILQTTTFQMEPYFKPSVSSDGTATFQMAMVSNKLPEKNLYKYSVLLQPHGECSWV